MIAIVFLRSRSDTRFMVASQCPRKPLGSVLARYQLFHAESFLFFWLFTPLPCQYLMIF